MKKLLAVFLFFVLLFTTVNTVFWLINVEKSKWELTKQLMLSNMILKKSNKWKNDIKSIDLLTSKLDKSKLEKIYLKIIKIDTSSNKMSKYKNMLDYLEAKIWLELLKSESVNIDNNDSSTDVNVIENNTNTPDNYTIEENTNNEQFYKINDSNITKLWVWISDLESTDMDFSKSETQKIGFTISFDISIYTEPWRQTLVSKHDTFWFRITNLTTWQSTTIPSYWKAFPWTNNKLWLLPEFFWDKNWKHTIKIETISNNIHVYSDYYGIDNITEFSVNVKWIWTWASKKVWVWETSNDCKTVLNWVTYTLEPCWWVNLELTKLTWDLSYKFKIKASKDIDPDIYIDIYWNKEYQANKFEWFPHNSLSVSNAFYNGEKHDSIDFKIIVNDRYLDIGKYSWLIYIWLKKWDVTPKNWLNLPIKVNVKSNTESNIDHCKTKVWDATLTLEPCSLKLTHVKWKSNKTFEFNVKSNDWKNHWFGFYWNMTSSGIFEYTWVPKYSLQIETSNWFANSPLPTKGYFKDSLMDIWTYNTFVYIVPYDNWFSYKALRLPIKLEVTATWTDDSDIIIEDKKDYCSALIDWKTYKLNPCSVSKNKELNFKIIPSDLNEVYTYEIYSWVSWWTKWEAILKAYMVGDNYKEWYVKIIVQNLKSNNSELRLKIE